MALYAVGKAQKVVLEALGRGDIASFAGAEAYFDRIGIVVSSRREGKASVPVITLKDSDTSDFNAYGEGEESSREFEQVDLSKVQQWMRK